MSWQVCGSRLRPAPVGLPLGGAHDFSNTTTSHPANISAWAHDTPAMLPPTTTALAFFVPIASLPLSLNKEEMVKLNKEEMVRLIVSDNWQRCWRSCLLWLVRKESWKVRCFSATHFERRQRKSGDFFLRKKERWLLIYLSQRIERISNKAFESIHCLVLYYTIVYINYLWTRWDYIKKEDSRTSQSCVACLMNGWDWPLGFANDLLHLHGWMQSFIPILLATLQLYLSTKWEVINWCF